nr:hypothetical protein HannXRQ_Chr14g0442131 [Tanacetum cinerariifolium]
MHIRKDPSFFLKNKTEAPQGEELGLMKPLSVSSCSCSASSFILDGVNLYGARATGATPGIKSIQNSTCLPDKSSGKLQEILEQLLLELMLLKRPKENTKVNTANPSAVSAAWVKAARLSAVSAARINAVKPSAVTAV